MINKLKTSWTPGNGIGDYIADSMARNEQGLCGQGCGIEIEPGAIRFLMGKLCPAHQEYQLEWMRAWINEE